MDPASSEDIFETNSGERAADVKLSRPVLYYSLLPP